MFVASLINTTNKSLLAKLPPNALILGAKARIAMTRARTAVSSAAPATGSSWGAATHAAASRGAFIVFEGGDRCGKTTQSQLLLANLQLQHCAVELWKFPDRKTQTGQMIDKYLAGTQDASDGTIHLLFSANRWEKEAALKAKLYSGITIIADRYAFSGAAYTSAKRNPQHSLEWCKAPDSNLPAPDLVFFLGAPAQLAQQRSDFGAERYEQAEFQAEVMRVFSELKDESWLELDASRSISDLETDVLEAAQQVVQACRERVKPLRRLWDRMPLGEDTLCGAG